MVADIVIILLKGIISGVLLSLFFSFGPAFFSLLQTSIHYGYRRAMPFAFGISAGDILMVFLMLTVLKNVDMYGILHNVYVASVASIMIVCMGLFTMFYRVKRPYDSSEKELPDRVSSSESSYSVFFRGFLINLVNPMIWVYWVSVIALMLGETDNTTAEVYLFFIGLLSATLLLDLLKCKMASLLQQVITPRILNICNKVIGVVLILFAVYIFSSMVLFNTDSEAKQQQQIIQQTEMLKSMHLSHGHHK